jgi:tetratricopeptide (TPR) repeat protein
MAGDAEEGLRRTLRGLEYTTSNKDRVAGLSNACAGYMMIGEPEKGLSYCNEALELNDQNWRALSNRALVFVKLGQYEEAEVDLQKAEAIAPNARTVKVVRSMLLDAVDPVAPQVIIDDRRQSTEEDDER